MGLAKKLAPNSKFGESITNVGFQWSTQSYTLKEIITKFKLPCVVQCSADSCSVMWSKFQFDLKQPLLLYTIRTVSKIYARTVRPNKTGLEYIEFGPPLVIPEDYEGWFGAVSSESNSLTRHTRVEEVAEAESDYFLAATKVPAFYLNGGESTGVYSQHFVYPGQVLRKDGFVNGPLDASGQANFAAKDKYHLRCVDDKEEEFVIPFSHRGLFYDVSKQIDNTANGVFNTTQIMDTGGSIFPLVLRHIQGDLPALNYSFTGTIQCNHIFSEQTILASSIGMDSNAPTPLELECKSKIKFSIALNEVDFKATNEYQRVLDFCNTKSEKYARAIKVSFTLKPEMSTLEELDFSLYDTGSDVEDVDAQSEFDIDWGLDNNDSKQALESFIKSKRETVSHLSSLEVPVDESVDMGTSFELERDSDDIVLKKAAEYTASLESQGSTLADVTVDSSLFDDSYMNKSLDNVGSTIDFPADDIVLKQAVEYTSSLGSTTGDVTMDSTLLGDSSKSLDNVDSTNEFPLEGIVLKRATERTTSVYSDTNNIVDVTVDSSLFNDSYLDKSLDNTYSRDGELSDTADVTMDDEENLTDAIHTPNIAVIKKPVKRLEYIGNLTKTAPGRLLKEEATRTSSGADANGSANNLTEDWGPPIPPIRKHAPGSIVNISPLTNGVVPIGIVGETADDSDSEVEVTVFGKKVKQSLIDLDSNSDSSDDEPCVVDLDKDLTGRLTSYRSMGSLNKLGANGEIHEDDVITRNDLISDCDSDVYPMNASFTGKDNSFVGSNQSLNDMNSTLSESEFILPNGYIHENQNKSDSSDFLEDVREHLDLDWDKSDGSSDSVIHIPPVLKPQNKLLLLPKSVMDMSLEEAAV